MARLLAASACAVAVLPMGASANSIGLTSTRLTSLLSCGLMSYPASANLSTDVYVKLAVPGGNNVADTKLTVSSLNAADQRTYIRFSLTCLNAIPATATVRSATVRLFTVTQVAPACRTVDIFPVASAWIESTITWNNQPAGTGANLPPQAQRTSSQQIGAPVGCANRTVGAYVNFDVTRDVVTFIAGTGTNNGWVLRDDSESAAGGVAQLTSFASRRTGVQSKAPTLMISYTP
jgi:hypothetical protein